MDVASRRRMEDTTSALVAAVALAPLLEATGIFHVYASTGLSA